MTSDGVATAERETPIFFSNGTSLLFGVASEPEEPRGVAVIALSGGVHIPSANRNRLWVHLNRRLTGRGYHTLRFDYRGTGESGGPSEAYSRDRPRSDDLMGAVGWMREQGVERFVLVGTCFGSLTALTTAPHIAGLEAAVLLSPLVLDSKSSAELASRHSMWTFARRALRPKVIRGIVTGKTRSSYLRIARAKGEVMRARSAGTNALPVSSGALSSLKQLDGKKIPMLILFGSEDAHYEDWKRAAGGRLGDVLERSTSIEVEVIPGYLHGFPQIAVQREALDMVTEWIAATPPIGGPSLLHPLEP